MAQSIILKRSALPGKVPNTGSLNAGEIAVNTYDGKLFIKRSGNVDSIEGIVVTNSTTTGSITLTRTGSFGELVVTQDANITRDLYVTNDIIGAGDIDITGDITGSSALLSGSLILSGSQTITNNLTVLGTVNARQFNISVISSSVLFQSGSTKFGDTSDDTHSFTGSVSINGNTTILNSLRIGSVTGSTENTLILGPSPAGGNGEGGQILLAASGGLYTSASMWDNYQNQTRLLRGTNGGSDGLVASWNMHTKQMQLPAYNSVSAFAGTAAANLAVNSNGDVITVSTTGASVFPYTGNAVITGSLTTTGIIYATPNGGMYFQGGDDVALYDINISNHIGIYGVQDSTVASIKLGSGGGIISGKNGSIGLGTINPTSGSLHVTGSIFAASITGAIAATNGLVSGSSQLTSSYDLRYALSGSSGATGANTFDFNLEPSAGKIGYIADTTENTQVIARTGSMDVLIAGVTYLSISSSAMNVRTGSITANYMHLAKYISTAGDLDFNI